jgi:hypothetical protein
MNSEENAPMADRTDWINVMGRRYEREVEPRPVHATEEERAAYFGRGMRWAREQDPVGADRAIDALFGRAADEGIIELDGVTADGETSGVQKSSASAGELYHRRTDQDT